MNVSEWWQALVLPERWSVCGVSVRALSVWHLYALEQTGNAFVNGGDITMNDVASLLLVCRTDYRSGRNLFVDPAEVKCQSTKMFKALRGKKDHDAILEAMDFFATCTESPRRWTDESKTNGISAPACRHIVLCLTNQYNFDHVAAWNHAYSDARCMYETWREREGDTSLVSAYQRKLIDEAERIKDAAGIKQ